MQQHSYRISRNILQQLLKNIPTEHCQEILAVRRTRKEKQKRLMVPHLKRLKSLVKERLVMSQYYVVNTCSAVSKLLVYTILKDLLMRSVVSPTCAAHHAFQQCSHLTKCDNLTFYLYPISQTRYGLMMPATADLIALRDAFDCDTDYLLFVERHVCTCLSGTQSGAI